MRRILSADSFAAIGAKESGPRTRRWRRLSAETRDRLLALGEECPSNPGREMVVRDLYGNFGSTSRPPTIFPGLALHRTISVFRSSRYHACLWSECDGAGGGQTIGEQVELLQAASPAQAKWMHKSGCSAMRWRAMVHPVCALGLCRTGLADRRSGAEGSTPVWEYEPGSWGPREVDKRFHRLVAGITRG